MESSRTLRRAELAAEIQRCRHSLHVYSIAHNKSSSAMKEHLAERVHQLSEELESMEREYHKLNVEQIRDELANS